MQLPGRLRSTTLGDLLGVLHRGRATGTLELSEDRGRTHRIHVTTGLILAVEIDGAAPCLAEILRREGAADDEILRQSLLRAIGSRRLHGEVLIGDFHLSPAVVVGALRTQVLARLALVEKIDDARIAFRVALRPPLWARQSAPIGPSEFLRGRPRARDGVRARQERTVDAGAWHVLGLAPGSDLTVIKHAYRRLVRSVHPDLHPHATDGERAVLEARFVQINEAFRRLVA